MDSSEYYRAVEQNIRKSGQHLQMILPSNIPKSPAFIYTIGNHEHGLPELLIIGNCDKTFAAILNDLGKRMRKRGRPFEDGELVNLGGPLPLKMVNAPPSVNEKFALQVGRYYHTKDYRVQQAVLCDPQGRFPGEAGCSPAYASQTDHLRAGLH